MTMQPTSRDDRVLRGLFTELADARTPDYLEAAIERASTRPQRPAWTFRERWLPMDVATRPVSAPTFPWRQVGVIALIGLMIAVAAAVYVGSQPRLPAPFGPAANGQIVFVDDGDIYVSDSLLAAPRPIVTGPGDDSGVRVSRDGRQISFQRATTGGLDLYVTAIAGGAVQKLNDEPLSEFGRAAWSPDGSVLAVDHTVGGVPVITMFATDGSSVRQLDTGGIHVWDPDWRPPDGRELVVRGEEDGRVDFYVVEADGSDIRALGVPSYPLLQNASDALLRPTWSPDGTRVAYHSNDVNRNGGVTGRWQTHVFDIASGVDLVLSPKGSPIQHDTEPSWSPDGTKLVTQRFIFGEAAWMAVLPSDGSGPGVDLDRRSEEYSPSGWSGQFSPDGSLVIAYYDFTDEAVTFDPSTGRSTAIDWPISEPPTYQRIAPD
jgi:WD40 repeat protein